MFAIIETGSKQYKVSVGSKINIEKLGVKKDENVVFDKVLLVAGGDKVKIGMPYVENAQVIGKVLDEIKGQKLIVFRYKPKKRYRKKKGHRQNYTRVEILEIK